MSKKLLSFFLAFLMLITLVIPASAAVIENDPDDEISPNGSDLTDPSIRDEGTTYPFLFSMHANAVYNMLTTLGVEGKSFELKFNTEIKTIRLSGTLYHSYAANSPNYSIKVGICYYDAQDNVYIPIASTHVTSGVTFTADQTVLDISHINFTRVYTCYGFIRNEYPQGTTYVSGDVNFYYTTY